MTDAMNEFFGDAPGRPDHPDFWKLSETVLGMDALTEETHGFEDALAAIPVDAQSLVYVAQQRASRAVDIDNPVTFVAGAACWLDGFIAGTRYRESKP